VGDSLEIQARIVSDNVTAIKWGWCYVDEVFFESL